MVAVRVISVSELTLKLATPVVALFTFTDAIGLAGRLKKPLPVIFAVLPF